MKALVVWVVLLMIAIALLGMGIIKMATGVANLYR